jgi:C-terminal processing protease CtpA/Prc
MGLRAASNDCSEPIAEFHHLICSIAGRCFAGEYFRSYQSRLSYSEFRRTRLHTRRGTSRFARLQGAEAGESHMKTVLTKTTVVGFLLLFACPLLSSSALLFSQTGPVNLNFEQGMPGQLPTGWYLAGSAPQNYGISLTTQSPYDGMMCAAIWHTGALAPNDFGTLAQGFDAAPFRGSRVRFRAAVRAAVLGSNNRAQLWLRVDRPNGQVGFLDNMANRPITSSRWGTYEIIGDVAADATQIYLGLILNGSGTAWIDDCSFEIIAQPDPIVEPARPLTARGLENVVAFTRLLGYIRHFHPSDEAAAVDWNRFAIEGMRAVENAGNATELADTLATLFHAIAPTLSVSPAGKQPPVIRPTPPPNPSGTVQAVVWNHLGFGQAGSQTGFQSKREYTNAPDGKVPDVAYQEPYQAELGGGVSCSLPLALFADSTGTWPRGTMPGPTTVVYSARDRATRLAAVALAWNVFQHFYPYFDVVDTDWPAALTAALSSAATDPDEARFFDTLLRLVAALHDGHGGVYNPDLPSWGQYGPPFTWDWIEGQLVITRILDEGLGLAPGDVVRSINGKPAAIALAEKESWISGATPQLIRYRGVRELYRGNQGESRTFEIEPWAGQGKQMPVNVPINTPGGSLTELRPSKIAELESGIFYVDLNRVSDEDILSALPQLKQAQGLIFDMRGYPGNIKNPATLFSHIIEQPVTSAWWNKPIVRFPDQKEMTFQVSRWSDILPQDPFLKGKKAFITDGRAISYAESCMGIVEHYRLAEIVGGPTAGTNGNVNPFMVPGGYQIYWTGLKVLKHDGSQHHGIGILPTVPAARTRAGAAAGVDELLQRAIQIVSPTSILEVQLPAGGAIAASTIGAGTPVQAGYAVAEITSGSAPYGVAVYSFKNSNGVIVSEAAVPVSPPTTSARVFVDYRSGVPTPGSVGARVDVDTGIALVNYGSVTANVSYTLRDKAGAVLVAGHGTIARGAHFAKLISQLSDLAPDFRLPDNFPTNIQFGSLDIASDQPLSVLALRITVNQRRETLLTSTPVVDLTRASGSLPLYFPQFADGGGYLTTLILLNTSTAVETGKLALLGDDGLPLVVRHADGTSGSTVSYSIQPGGTYRFQTAGSSENAAVGWVQVTPDAGTQSPAGAGIFSFSQEGILVTESGIPAAALTTHARIYVDHSGNRGTGLAIANPANSELNVTLMAYEKDGNTPAGNAGDPLILQKSGHTARFVSQMISGLPAEFSGVLDISSSSPFIALTLQSLTNSRGDFLLTTFPIADATQPAPAPIVFPQIADGGGYLTRFVFIAAGAPAGAELTFYADNGTLLAVGSSKGVVKF